MWKIFQKEALGILRYTSRIDFLKIPDHVVLSEFTEMKVTLKTNSVEPMGAHRKSFPKVRDRTEKKLTLAVRSEKGLAVDGGLEKHIMIKL